MKTKLEMAHDYLRDIVSNWEYDDSFNPVDEAWKLADAMQAEADKRNNKETCDKNIGLDSFVLKEWQPDWSQAPNRAMYWAMDGCGKCNWYEREPEVFGSQWDWGSVIEQADTGYGYQGDWRESLRKRPN